MAFGVLFSVVMSSSPAARAVLTSAEAHYRSMAAFRSTIAITTRVRPNEITFGPFVPIQSPGRSAFVPTVP